MGLGALYRFWQRGPNLAPKETLAGKLLAHIGSLSWEHIDFSRGYVWPSEPLKQKVSALRKLRSAFLDAAYRTI